MKEPVPTPLVIVLVAILFLIFSMIGHVVNQKDKDECTDCRELNERIN